MKSRISPFINLITPNFLRSATDTKVLACRPVCPALTGSSVQPVPAAAIVNARKDTVMQKPEIRKQESHTDIRRNYSRFR